MEVALDFRHGCSCARVLVLASSRSAGFDASGLPEQIRREPQSGYPATGRAEGGDQHRNRRCAPQRTTGKPRFRHLYDLSGSATLP